MHARCKHNTNRSESSGGETGILYSHCMSSTPPDESSKQLSPRANVERGERHRSTRAVGTRTVVYEYRGNWRVGGIAGFMTALLLVVAALAFLVLGAITLTLFVWVALGAVVLALIAGAFRRLSSRGSPDA